MTWLLKLGEQIKTARKAKGFTQEKLARRISKTRVGVSRESISQIENGKAAPAVNIVTEIAAALEAEFEIEGIRITGIPISSAHPVAVARQLDLAFDTLHTFGSSSIEIKSGNDLITLDIRLKRDVA